MDALWKICGAAEFVYTGAELALMASMLNSKSCERLFYPERPDEFRGV